MQLWTIAPFAEAGFSEQSSPLILGMVVTLLLLGIGLFIYSLLRSLARLLMGQVRRTVKLSFYLTGLVVTLFMLLLAIERLR